MARPHNQLAFLAILLLAALALNTSATAGERDNDEPRYARTELHLISEGRFRPDGILFATRGAAGLQGPVYLLSTRKVAVVKDEDKV